MPLINPISFRLGKTRYWETKRIFSPKYASNYYPDFAIEEIIRSVFSNRLEPKYGLMYSHMLMRLLPKKYDITIYLYDTQVDDYISEVARCLFEGETYRNFYSHYRPLLPSKIIMEKPAVEKKALIRRHHLRNELEEFFNTPRLIKKKKALEKKKRKREGIPIEINASYDYPLIWDNDSEVVWADLSKQKTPSDEEEHRDYEDQHRHEYENFLK